MHHYPTNLYSLLIYIIHLFNRFWMFLDPTATPGGDISDYLNFIVIGIGVVLFLLLLILICCIVCQLRNRDEYDGRSPIIKPILGTRKGSVHAFAFYLCIARYWLAYLLRWLHTFINHCIVSHCIVLHCIALRCVALQYCIVLYFIVLYLYIYLALLAVHTNQKRFQCERPREKRAVLRERRDHDPCPSFVLPSVWIDCCLTTLCHNKDD